MYELAYNGPQRATCTPYRTQYACIPAVEGVGSNRFSRRLLTRPHARLGQNGEARQDKLGDAGTRKASGHGRGRTGQSGPSRQDRCTPTPRNPRLSRDDQGRQAGLLVVVRARGRSRRSARTRRARSTCGARPSRSLRPPRLFERSGTRGSISPSTTRLTGPSSPRMRPTSSGSATTHRLATIGPSGLRHACRRPAAGGVETWRGAVHRTDVGRCRPTTTQCRDFTLNRSANWTQLT